MVEWARTTRDLSPIKGKVNVSFHESQLMDLPEIDTGYKRLTLIPQTHLCMHTHDKAMPPQFEAGLKKCDPVLSSAAFLRCSFYFCL